MSLGSVDIVCVDCEEQRKRLMLVPSRACTHLAGLAFLVGGSSASTSLNLYFSVGGSSSLASSFSSSWSSGSPLQAQRRNGPQLSACCESVFVPVAKPQVGV